MRAFLLLALLPVAAQAETLAESHFRLNFCYRASFDAAHLEEHPEQQVRSIALGREPAGMMTKLGEVTMEVEVIPRDGSGELDAVARCRPEGDGLLCAMDDRAGGFALEAQGDDLVLAVGSKGMLFEGWSDETRLEPEEGEDLAFAMQRCG